MPQVNMKEGDLVRLRSGGPVMTAEQVFLEVRMPYARCAWFDEGNLLKRGGSFNLGTLEMVEPQETEP